MKKKTEEEKKATAALNQAVSRMHNDKYVLRLFITGTTSKSVLALTNLKKICEEYLKGRYDLEVIDLYQKPDMARDEQIIAAPTLIKKLPLPFRRIIGDMSDIEKVLIGLEIKKL
ncbi:MAG: circadian clock KaiB family protein [Bacteroidales bacterium]|nr:circadian clock KaiB family protein [Bacteroidales bacterium]